METAIDVLFAATPEKLDARGPHDGRVNVSPWLITGVVSGVVADKCGSQQGHPFSGHTPGMPRLD
jgi:hypothetical protein